MKTAREWSYLLGKYDAEMFIEDIRAEMRASIAADLRRRKEHTHRLNETRSDILEYAAQVAEKNQPESKVTLSTPREQQVKLEALDRQEAGWAPTTIQTGGVLTEEVINDAIDRVEKNFGSLPPDPVESFATATRQQLIANVLPVFGETAKIASAIGTNLSSLLGIPGPPPLTPKKMKRLVRISEAVDYMRYCGMIGTDALNALNNARVPVDTGDPEINSLSLMSYLTVHADQSFPTAEVAAAILEWKSWSKKSQLEADFGYSDEDLDLAAFNRIFGLDPK